ncbi:MAG TPA: transmembrane 220 family protein [Kofleriaceae bacterium]|nr:transmembrane 220 family protein [Kofleriaceae bacterium]
MRTVPRWFLILCWVMAVLFMVCVGLQENDPDPVRWMAIYGAAGLACALLPAKRVVAIPAVLVGLVAAAWGAYLAHQVIDVLSFSDLFLKMDEKGGAVEVGREAGGLTIVAVFLLAAAGFRATRA